jgi:hypothetical protein
MRTLLLLCFAALFSASFPGSALSAQAPEPPTPSTPAPTPAQSSADQNPPDAPQPAQSKTLQQHAAPTPSEQAQQQAATLHPVYLINGAPYVRPTTHDLLIDYVKDSYGLNAFVRSTVRALYTEARDEPSGWSTDIAGYGQRQGSAEAVTAINGNVRLGMEFLFHEDLRYYPCRGCSIKRKFGNALLAEFTARHDSDGRRFFTLTPVISDFSGPIIAHSIWYPGGVNPFGGVVATRTVFATRVGFHLFQEFRPYRHHPHPEVSAP